MRAGALLAACLVAALCFTAGCATKSAGIQTTSNLSKSKVERVREGMTREEVISILGPPESKLTLDDGETLFFKDVNLSSCWVSLDRQGKVSGSEWSE